MKFKSKYQMLLESQEWHDKRSIILNRDRQICKGCNNKFLLSDNEVGFYIYKMDNPVFLIFDTLNNKVKGRYVTAALANQLPQSAIIFFTEEVKEPNEQDRKRIYISGIREMIPEEINYFDDLRLENYLRKVNHGLSPRPFVLQPIFNDNLNWMEVKGLNVHHSYYQSGKMPWEYPDSSLKTYCQSCHMDLHKDIKVPVLDSNGKLIDHYTPCPRCAGAGWIPEYKHVQGGICFKCNGARYLELIHN